MGKLWSIIDASPAVSSKPLVETYFSRGLLLVNMLKIFVNKMGFYSHTYFNTDHIEMDTCTTTISGYL